jgi:uncharacterized protein (TIGR02147 family)
MLIECLQREFTLRRGRNSSYSLRSYARSLGINPGALSQILNGKRPLTAQATKKILQSMNMDFIEKQKILQSWMESDDGKPFTDISQIQDEIIGDWRYLAIHSVLQTKNGTKPQQISKRLGLHISEVLTLLGVLARHNLVKEFKKDEFQVISPDITTSHEVPSEVLRKGNRQWIEKSLEALDCESVQTRDITGITMAIDTKKIPGAKQLIKEFRRKLCRYLESGHQESAYRINIQLFPIERQK